MAHTESDGYVPGHSAAIILARGGSKGIKLKNIKMLAGLPLVAWALRATIDSGVFDSVWVSTDHDEIARISSELGASVYRRSAHSARDTASSVEAIQEFLELHPEIDEITMVQCTSPCFHPWHLQDAARMVRSGRFDSVFAVTRNHRFRWQEVDKQSEQLTRSLNIDNLDYRPRRQDWEGELSENGAFYFTQARTMMKGLLQGGRPGYYEMGPEYSVDIDTDMDWQIAEQRIIKFGYFGKTKPQGVKLTVFGIDGVLTDNSIHFTEEGGQITCYNQSDAVGIELLKKAGVTVKLLSTEENKFHQKLADKLGVEIKMGCEDKLAQLKKWRNQLELDMTQVAFMGCDVYDLECVKLSGIGGAPRDAQHDVRVISSFVANLDGGRGAGRDFCNHILLVMEKAKSIANRSEI